MQVEHRVRPVRDRGGRDSEEQRGGDRQDGEQAQVAEEQEQADADAGADPGAPREGEREGDDERGLPALAVWCWFVGAAALGLWRKFRRDRARYLSAAGLGALAAMLAAGFFEYNFGDSEFLLTLLILLTLPWAAARDTSASVSVP